MREGRRHLLEAGVAIERRVEDASHRGHENREQEEIKNHQKQADEQAAETAYKRGGDQQADTGQHENHGNKAKAEAANDLFSPSVAEELGGALHGVDGGKVFEGQHRDHEIAGQRPGETDNPDDNAPDKAQALFQSAQDDADGRSDERPLQNGALARPGQFEAVTEGPRAAHQAAIGDANEGDVEEHDHEIIHDVYSEQADQKHRRLVRIEAFAGSNGRGPCRQHQERAASGNDGRDNKTRNSREHREQHQLFVGTKNGEALLDELPTTRKLTHRTLPRNWKRRNRDLGIAWRSGPPVPIVRSMYSLRTGNESDKRVFCWPTVDRRHRRGVYSPHAGCVAQRLRNRLKTKELRF